MCISDVISDINFIHDTTRPPQHSYLIHLKSPFLALPMIKVYGVKLICPFCVTYGIKVSSPGCSQEHQRIISLETEIDGYKRSTQKEQEQNEKLMMILNKAENDIATIRKQMAQCQTKLDALKNEYATYTRMLLETEQSLNRANAVSMHVVAWSGFLNNVVLNEWC